MSNTMSETSPEAGTDHGEPPLLEDQEWANALTHAAGALATLIVGSHLVLLAFNPSSGLPRTGLAIACSAYVAGVFGTFLCSTLSHVVRRQPALNTMRTWDQAMIYTMIAGTYTPIVYAFATEAVRVPLLIAIWVAAAAGFYGKVALRHRINSIGTISYLLLGWLPAIPLAGHVPSTLAWLMLLGGVVYTIGVLFLINDKKLRYMHAVWHLFVIGAASCHYFGILHYVVDVA